MVRYGMVWYALTAGNPNIDSSFSLHNISLFWVLNASFPELSFIVEVANPVEYRDKQISLYLLGINAQ